MKLRWLSAQQEFESWFQTKDSFCFEFHDARIAKGTGGSNRIFTASHPADYVVVHKGAMFYAEVKSSQETVSFPFGNIKKSQWNAAIRTVVAGGSYFFFLKKEATGIWYKVPASVLIEVQSLGLKSIRWDALDLKGFRYERPVS